MVVFIDSKVAYESKSKCLNQMFIQYMDMNSPLDMSMDTFENKITKTTCRLCLVYMMPSIFQNKHTVTTHRSIKSRQAESHCQRKYFIPSCVSHVNFAIIILSINIPKYTTKFKNTNFNRVNGDTNSALICT